ncbi:MAG TPA: glycosyltransferase family 2 protein [Spirochaetota bacterium]
MGPTTIKKISYVIPVFNEEENIPTLYSEVTTVSRKLGYPYEIIFVNDCSSDNSLSLLKKLTRTDKKVRCLSFAKNCGQSAALAAGFEAVTGDTVITMDADLQNDPADIPYLLTHYKKSDMVTGWRHNRQDTLSKRWASKFGNGVRNLLTGDSIHDTGCSLKILKASYLKRIKIFKGLHRFLPTLMRMEGATVVEAKVNHRPRVHGYSKYSNWRRGIEGFQDLLAVRWMIKRNLSYISKEV